MFSKAAKVNRRRTVKKGIDADEARRKREDTTNDIRKNKREDQIAKRRVANNGAAAASSMPSKENQVVVRDADVQAKLQLMPTWKEWIYSQNPQMVLDGVTNFRKLLSIERDPPITEVIDTGIIPKLVQFLGVTGNTNLQFEAAWALTNIASGTTNHTAVVISSGAVQAFIQLLSSPSADVAEQAVWALGNIAGDSCQCRDMVLKSGILPPLLNLCKVNAKVSLLRNVTWALSNLCRGKPQPPFEFVSPALPTLAQLIHSKDEEVLTDACWALSYLSDDTGTNNLKIQAVVQSGVARRLVELLTHPQTCVKTPALRTIGNIVTGDDLQTQIVLNCSALTALLSLLNNPKRGIRKEACWTISNITAGNQDQIKAVFEANIIPPLIAILRNAEFDIRKEAAWAISNATSGGSDEQIKFLVQQGCIGPMCALFNSPDPKMILVSLEGIENILRVGARLSNASGEPNKFAQFVEACGGLDALENLQHHDSEKIYEKASRILSQYFEGAEEEEDASLAPQQGNDAFQFNAGGVGDQPKFSF